MMAKASIGIKENTAMGSLTGIKNKAGKITYWINGKKVTKEQWEAHQDAFAELGLGNLLKKRKR